ncbi:unnamed protein product [Heterobilharzia americana]|nr:unnamed protein product [Heterobilharzia americana]
MKKGRGQTIDKVLSCDKSHEHNKVTSKHKKAKFHELLAWQKELKGIKREKQEEIEKKRQERLKKRKERNVSMQKLTRKGQPVMKHRIKLLLKQLCTDNS